MMQEFVQAIDDSMDADAEELCGHMEVCDAIMAASRAKKEGENDG